MKAFLLIFATVISPSICGVMVADETVEREALRLWEKFCSGTSDQGVEDNILVYCKKAPSEEPITLEHSTELPSRNGSDVVVFVKPPSFHYQHNVTLTGGEGGPQKTVIYVKPANNSHEINFVDNRPPPVESKKPTVYFLKGAHGGDSKAQARGLDAGAPTGPVTPLEVESGPMTPVDAAVAAPMTPAEESAPPPPELIPTEVLAAPSATRVQFSPPARNNPRPIYYWNGFENKRFRNV